MATRRQSNQSSGPDPNQSQDTEALQSTQSPPIVPADFAVPLVLRTERTILRPLGPEHNEADHGAWTSSVDHIRATPGFDPAKPWPADAMTLDQNLGDVERHAEDFEARTGFTYTVLDIEDETSVVGCVYIYGSPEREGVASVRSWVVGDRPELDVEVWLAVTRWLETDWPFDSFEYAARRSA